MARKVEDIFSIFTNLITNIQRCINTIKDKNMKAIGLKSGYVSCLFYIGKFGSLSQGQLCDVCNENKAAISRKIEYLEKNGYVEKDLSSNAKYKNPITLTKKGKETADFIANKISEIISKANTEISENDRDILYASLEKINSNLKKIIKEEEN